MTGGHRTGSARHAHDREGEACEAEPLAVARRATHHAREDAELATADAGQRTGSRRGVLTDGRRRMGTLVFTTSGGKLLFELCSCRQESTCTQRVDEARLPRSGHYAGLRFPDVVRGRHVGRNDDLAGPAGIEEGLAGAARKHGLHLMRFAFSLSRCVDCSLAGTALVGKVGGCAEQLAQVVDGPVGRLEVLPHHGHDVGQKLALLLRFLHQFENQEFMKTQGPQPLKVRWQLPRLSLLKSSRAKIFIYSTVCHTGRRCLRGKVRRAVCFMALRGRIMVDGPGGWLDEPEKLGGQLGEVEVRTTKEAGFRRPY